MSNIDIKYNNTKLVNGTFLTPLETKNEPTITYTSSDNNEFYTFIMYDSKAVSKTKNHNHWLIINITGTSLNEGNLTKSNTLLPYNGPTPPINSGTHIYHFELYKQNGNINQIEFNDSDRVISLSDTKKKIGINDLTPIAKKYFFSEYTSNGGKNLKNKKRKTIKKNRTNKKRKTIKN